MALSCHIVIVLTFLTFSKQGKCCTPTPGKGGGPVPGSHVTYSKVGDDWPTITIANEEPKSIKRSVLERFDLLSSENVFLQLDENDDGVIDACEWSSAPYATRVKDFANILEDMDLDGDDVITMEEFIPVQITTT